MAAIGPAVHSWRVPSATEPPGGWPVFIQSLEDPGPPGGWPEFHRGGLLPSAQPFQLPRCTADHTSPASIVSPPDCTLSASPASSRSEWSQASPAPSAASHWPLVPEGYERLRPTKPESERSESGSGDDPGLAVQWWRSHGFTLVTLAGLGVVLVACAIILFQPQRRVASDEVLLGHFWDGRSVLGRPRRLFGELYTFGAPGSSLGGLYDESQDDGCIPGLRVFSRTERRGADTPQAVADPVSWITAMFNFSHAKMEALEASDQNVRENPVHPCSAVKSDPQRDDFWWMNGHLVYETVLKAHVDFLGGPEALTKVRRLGQGTDHSFPERLRRTHLMIHLSFMVYTPHVSKLVVDAADWGWNLVGHAASESKAHGHSFFQSGRKDHVTLYQHADDLQCILAIEGTNTDDKSDLLSDLNIKSEEFCGFGLVHAGFKTKLMKTLRSRDYEQVIRPKLPYCSSIAVTGHSMGGAQAELLLSCANRNMQEGAEGYEDHQLTIFSKESASLLPSFHEEQVQGTFLRNKGTGLCLDVTGAVNTHSNSDIVLWECELPGSNFSKDQRWKLTPEGFLVSTFSGLCVALSVANPELGGSVLRQWPCEYDVGESSVQRWEHTPEGFLKHSSTDSCINSKLAAVPCSHTDQRWQVLSDGHILNKLSGLCMGLEGLPGTEEDGTSVILWECEYIAETNQRWDILPSGTLQNRLNKKCLTWEPGLKMNLQLAPCESASTVSVKVTQDGFIQNQETGMCINVDGDPGRKPGTAVTLATCEDKHIETSGIWKFTPEGFIRNVGNDWENQHKCLELYGRPETDDKAAPGAPIHLDYCEIATDQTWEVTAEGYVKSTIGGRKCLGIDSAAGTVRLQNCEGWHVQRGGWRLTPEGELQNLASGRCMTAPAASQGGSTAPQLLACGGSLQSAQVWHLRSDGTLLGQANRQCLTLDQDKTELSLQPCSESTHPRASQQWQITKEGLLRGADGTQCVLQQVASNQLGIQACPSSQQLWDLGADGLLRNVHTGQCAHAAPAPAQMPKLSLSSTCEGDSLFHQWEKVYS